MIIPLLAMNAEIDLMASAKKRTIKLTEFFTGPRKCALRPNEILVGIKAAPLSKRYGSCFIKISRTAEDLSKVSVATALTVRNKKFKDVRLSLGSVAPTPIKAFNAENYLEGREISERVIDEAVKIACSEIKPISDNRSTAKYRKEVAGVVIKCAIKKALDRRSVG
jgi:CO/xanthine dehydrogenase FAD-binding subunit